MIDKIKITQMKKEQVQNVFVLSCDCFSTPWSYESIYSQIENPHAKTFVAVRDLEISGNMDDMDEILGFIDINYILDECDINNIAVNEKYRKMGIGKKLVEKLINFAKEQGIKSIMLEVRESSSNAIGFYENLGFKQVGLRKNYYTKPTENALLFTKDDIE